jgi:hypothetical protein
MCAEVYSINDLKPGCLSIMAHPRGRALPDTEEQRDWVTELARKSSQE